MDPYASLILGEVKMQELRRQAALHRRAAQARPERSGRFRTATGEWLIYVGERLIPTPSHGSLHLER